ncbi:MAG: TetR/AcrR family transcriptional regulator [Rhodobacter sp.]|nr:TetR/AcrR family transcriptional regulator [Paracoccaceae bacterium]MCC0077242.1 TetR/AcrR family transcriptional regulator [Rhodobacter sp.]
MSQDTASPKRRGRPPSKAARSEALAAAREILATQGFGRVTIEAVASRSGVGKPTIYRHWANAGELTMEALMSDLPASSPASAGSLVERLRAQLCRLVEAFATTRGRQVAMVLAASDPESEMTKAFRHRVILSSREHGRALILDAVQAGEINRPEDIDVVLDMIYAPLFYRLLLGHLPLDPEFADRLAARAGQLMDCDAKKRL